MFSNEDLFVFLMILWGLWLFLDYLDRFHPKQQNQEKRKKKGKRRRLRPQTPDDCELCQLGLHDPKPPGPRQVTPWRELKHPADRKKRVNSDGKACPRRCCVYYGITEAHIHALVSNGWRGKNEKIRQWKCQACGCKFTDRRQTPMYRLKTASKRVAQVMRFCCK